MTRKVGTGTTEVKGARGDEGEGQGGRARRERKNVEVRVELNVECVGVGQSGRQGHVFISTHRERTYSDRERGLQLRNMAVRSPSARFRG